MKIRRKQVVLLVFALSAGVIHSCTMKKDDNVLEIAVSETTGSEQEEEAQTTDKKVCVHITGCVVSPGVYYAEEGSRIFEVVELAGGFSKDAQTDSVNLARVVMDAEKIHIYSKEEAGTLATKNTEEVPHEGNAPVNLNTADRETLMELPGIGASKADAIIKYRQDNGGFSKIEDVMEISGIKEGAFEKIKNLITV